METTIEKCIEQKFIPFTYWKNAPACDILNIIETTEKAILIEHEEVGKKLWLPKSVFEPTQYGAFTIKKWFKSKLNNYQQKALHVMV